MEQAIAEATDDSSRTASFIVWRTRELLAGRGHAGVEPSRATMFLLFSRLSAGKHTTGSAATRNWPGITSRDALPPGDSTIPLSWNEPLPSMTCCDALTTARPRPTISRGPPVPPGNPGGQGGREPPGTGGSQPARAPERQPGREPGHPKYRSLP
jgi:hypothetical protein